MAFKDFLGGRKLRSGGDFDIENYLNDLTIRNGRIIEDDNAIYVKSVKLDSEGNGVENAIDELEKGNLVVLNVKALFNNRPLLMQIVGELRETCVDMSGDIAKISEDKILIVPSGIRIASTERGPE